MHIKEIQISLRECHSGKDSCLSPQLSAEALNSHLSFPPEHRVTHRHVLYMPGNDVPSQNPTW